MNTLMSRKGRGLITPWARLCSGSGQETLNCLQFLPSSGKEYYLIWLIWSFAGQLSVTGNEKLDHPSDIQYKSSDNILPVVFPSYFCYYSTTSGSNQSHRNLPNFSFFSLQTFSKAADGWRYKTMHIPHSTCFVQINTFVLHFGPYSLRWL